LKKAWVAFQVGYLTFAVLIAGSIYSSGVKEVSTITFPPLVALAEFMRVQERFHIGKVASVLGLTTYVAGNGIGVMILSPLTDIPRVGRTTVYLGTLVIFVACQAPIALAVNFGMLLAFRFLAGFAGSLPLAVAGASFSDMYPSSKRSYSMLWWNMACLCAPSKPLLQFLSLR
jgi:DHA1 family multidrug resistance protein-like MFS transporter